MTRGHYSDASKRHAEQTRDRAEKRRREKEAARLRRLGADEAWITRVLGSLEPRRR